MTTSIAPRRDLCTISRWSDQLPPAAHDSRVTVLADLDAWTAGCCALCLLEVPGEVRITFRYQVGGTPYPIDVCGARCAETQLRELLERGLYARPALDITVHLPSDLPPLPVAHQELVNIVDCECEGRPGCDAPVSYAVTWSTRNGTARRETCCRAHLPELVDYAEKFGDRWTGPSVHSLPVSARELATAA